MAKQFLAIFKNSPIDVDRDAARTTWSQFSSQCINALENKNHVTIAIHFTIAELKTAVKNIEKKSGTHVGGLELTTLMQFLSDIYFMIVFLKENLSINLAPFMNKDDDHQS